MTDDEINVLATGLYDTALEIARHTRARAGTGTIRDHATALAMTIDKVVTLHTISTSGESR